MYSRRNSLLEITEIKVPGYYKVARGINSATGLDAIISVHSKDLGIALGGCRYMKYDNYEDHLQDALNLSKGMTYKNSTAGLNLGGGKTAINAHGPFNEEVAKSFGEFINEFNKDDNIYVTAGDIGTGLKECEMIAKYTPHIQGVVGNTDSGWATAYGVFMAMSAAVEYNHLKWKDTHVAVNGLGKVGSRLVQFLHGVNAHITVADIRQEVAIDHCDKYGCDMRSPVDIHKTKCHVYAPCAIGGAINETTVTELDCNIVCGGANNQLTTPLMGTVLKNKGITYVPDFVANAGGVIIVSTLNDKLMDLDYHNPLVIGKLNNISITVKSILDNSNWLGRPTDVCAIELARERLNK